MTRGGGLVLFMTLTLLATWLPGCSGCRHTEVLATLTTSKGGVERDHAAKVGAWQKAEHGAEFFVGDGVRSGKASAATLRLVDGSDLSLEAETLIRFLARASGSKHQRFDLEMGEAVLQTGSEGLTLETELGLAVLSPGSRVTLGKTARGTRYEVSVGMAEFDGQGGAKLAVHGGESIVVGVGVAELEARPQASAAPPTPPPAPAASAEPPPTATTGPVTAHINGGGASVRGAGEKKFSHVAAGTAELAAGSTLRLATGTTADVERSGQRATLRGSGDFVIGDQGQPFITASGGGISIDHAATAVSVAVPGGSIVAKLGATADVRVQKDRTQVNVKAGEVEMTGPDGTEVLAAGEQGTLGAKGGTEVVGRGAAYMDFPARAGDSFAVHDPSPPTAVGFQTSSACPGDAIVELTRTHTRARGSGAVNIVVPPGSHPYEVHCVGADGISPDVAATGTVTIIHDGGTARIPRTAPSTFVDMDGRNYTVLYQTLLPKISVRWPGAPKGAAYTLKVASSSGKSQSFSAGSPSYSFASGALGEGTHTLSFQSSAGEQSKATSLNIRFDNATPTATLTSPANGSFGPGSGVSVAGVVLEGWKVYVGGAELPLDSQLRFSGSATAPGGQRSLAVQFVHPRRGVHYYLRRAAGH